MKTYCLDIDNTLTFTEGNRYSESVPNFDMIDRVNRLFYGGNTIKLFTARGMTKFSGDREKIYSFYYQMTYDQLKNWGVNFHELILAKPSYDIFVDDKNLTIDEFKNKHPLKIGFIAGAFDILHPGYISMFSKAKENCDYLIVGLHSDPSIERSDKLKPIFTIEERREALLSLKYVDRVMVYDKEGDLYDILKTEKIDVRFLGDDYICKDHLGSDLNIPIFYIDRSHGWSYKKVVSCIKSS